LVYALVDEAHQWTVPMRSCSVADVVVDAAGCAFVLLWPCPFRSGDDRPASLFPAAACLLAGAASSYLGVTADLPGDHLLAEALGVVFGTPHR
jgi:hypothetical protein